MIDINVIPLIDVLLVVLIFLTATTTFSKVDDIAVNLPASTVSSSPYEANLLAISQDGQYALNGQLITGVDTSDLQEAFSALQPGEPLIIYADVATPHASVIRALEAAHHSNLTKLSFATQSTP
ncbi:biopolymer transporter ExbD [Paenalcaligenes niemegkensis]|uniref:ExbD/TolR family protein n=1 Tax=Paenalcaligenes niemegkensis TaxID=2895469 RepID=UPI001EE7C3ED|nr:biopolymer transporter ExbD [Paenalcaligenes niemegkensis]MCQ9616617.1 biopolymer transporter ExbD [Paenalcaligenes niemegkensis]